MSDDVVYMHTVHLNSNYNPIDSNVHNFYLEHIDDLSDALLFLNLIRLTPQYEATNEKEKKSHVTCHKFVPDGHCFLSPLKFVLYSKPINHL